MPKASLRDNILEAGLRVMFRKGYGGAGVRDIIGCDRQGALYNGRPDLTPSKAAYAERKDRAPA